MVIKLSNLFAYILLTQINHSFQYKFIPSSDNMVELFLFLRTQDNKNKNPKYIVFSIRTGKPLKSLRKPFERTLKKAGIDDFRFHDLRHTFASHYIMNCGVLLSLKDILDHSSLKMVKRYSHLASAYKRKMINNLNGKFTICHLIATSEVIFKMEEKKSLISYCFYEAY